MKTNFDDLNLMAAQLLLDPDRSQLRDAFDQRWWTGKGMVVLHTPQTVVTPVCACPRPGHLIGESGGTPQASAVA